MTPKEIVEKWVGFFNNADINGLENLYADDAINHQMPNEPVKGKKEIAQMFRNEFVNASEMYCIPVQIIEQNNWAVLEWRDPKGFAGCGFFNIIDGLIKVQRGYWDKLSFNKLYDNVV